MIRDKRNALPLKSYLLGDLNPDEREQLEQRLTFDPNAFEELLLVEEKLIDDYLEGVLSAHEKKKFRKIFLATPERQQKLSFAKALNRHIGSRNEQDNQKTNWLKSWLLPGRHQNQVLKWALAASLLLLVGGGYWSALRTSRLQVALDREQSLIRESQEQLREIENRNFQLMNSLELEQARTSGLEQEVANLKRAQKPDALPLPRQIRPPLLIASLSPGRSRDINGMQQVTVPSETDMIQLDLKMEPLDYPAYQAALERIGAYQNSTIISQRTQSILQGQFGGFYISAELLKEGPYLLKLNGITDTGSSEEIANYYFRVNRQ